MACVRARSSAKGEEVQGLPAARLGGAGDIICRLTVEGDSQRRKVAELKEAVDIPGGATLDKIREILGDSNQPGRLITYLNIPSPGLLRSPQGSLRSPRDSWAAPQNP